jgi:hypothetical protein
MAYIPTDPAEYRKFSNNYSAKVNANKLRWSIPNDAAKKLVDGNAEWNTAQDLADADATRTKITLEKAKRLREADTENIRWMTNTYIKPNVYGTITPEDFVDLGVNPGGGGHSPEPAPASRPIFSSTSENPGELIFHVRDSKTNKQAKPEHADAMLMRCLITDKDVVDPAELTEVEIINHCFFKKRFKPQDRGKKIHIIACWINRKRQPGPDSEVYTAIIT